MIIVLYRLSKIFIEYKNSHSFLGFYSTHLALFGSFVVSPRGVHTEFVAVVLKGVPVQWTVCNDDNPKLKSSFQVRNMY